MFIVCHTCKHFPKLPNFHDFDLSISTEFFQNISGIRLTEFMKIIRICFDVKNLKHFFLINQPQTIVFVHSHVIIIV